MSRRSALRSSPLLLLGTLVAGAFLVLVGVSLAQEFRRQVLLEQHVRSLRREIEERESRLEKLRRGLAYLSTDAYAERAAREKLNYQKPGEKVIVVPEVSAPRPELTVTPTPVPTLPPWKLWVRHIFGPASGVFFPTPS